MVAMKSLLLTLLAVFGTTVSSAQFLETADGLIMFINAAVIPAPVIPDLMIQEFETGTLPSGWGSEGGPIYNYTPPLRGNYSLGLLDTDGKL